MRVKANEIEKIQVGDCGYYVSADWQYPAITSVLDSMPEKQEGLQFWKDYLLKTGNSEEEAEKIMADKRKISAQRGTDVHELCENYLLDGREPFEAISLEDHIFELCKPELDKLDLLEIDGVKMAEQIVYSHSLGVAGRLDYCGYYDGTLSIVDIKTTDKLKAKKQRKSWYLQACFYSLALFEMYGKLAEQIVIINPSEEMKLRVYIEDLHQHTQELMEVIDNFKEKK